MPARQQIGWIDLLRVLACFLVIVSHSCDPFVGKYDNDYNEFFFGSVIGSLVRCSVPLFVMMSGVLLLPIKMDMPSFYAKRTKRLLIPFLFWALVLPVLYFLYVNYSGIEIISPNILAEEYTVKRTLEKMFTFVFNFNYDTTVLWYVYMLIGLYLFMPILSAWLKQAEKRDLHWFMGFWVVSMCLPYVQMAAPFLGYTGNFGNMGIWGVCDWNPYGTLYYFSGFSGYLVLAYYLMQYPLQWSWRKTATVAISLFLVGYGITIGGYLITQHYYPGSYANLEIIWLFAGINVFLMTFSVFIVMQKVKVKSTPLLAKMASLTFGIFLSHFIFVQWGYDLIYPNLPVPPVVKILLIALFAFTVSLAITWLMSLNKYMRKTVM